MRSTLAIFLLVILVPSFFALALVTSVRSNLLQASFFKSTLARERVYDLALDTVVDKLDSLKMEENQIITVADVKAAVPRIITTAWLQRSVEQTLDSAFSWFNQSGSAALTLPLDLRDPKQRLTDEVNRLFDQKIATLPTCRTRQEPTEKDLCKPAGMSGAALRAEIVESGFNPDEISKQIPDSIDLLHPDLGNISLSGEEAAPKTSEGNNQTIELQRQLGIIRDRYQMALGLLRGADITIGILLAGYVALVWRGVRRTVRWVGVLLFCLGILPLAVGLATEFIVRHFVLSSIHFNPEDAALATTVNNLILDVRQAIFQPLFIVGLILILVGLASIVGSYFLPKRQPKPKEA